MHYDAETILRPLANREAMDYDPQPKGLRSAREAVAAYYREQHEEFDLDPESLILTTSTSEGYSYVFRLLCNPDDEILVPKPSYPLVRISGRPAGCEADAVPAALRSRLAD